MQWGPSTMQTDTQDCVMSQILSEHIKLRQESNLQKLQIKSLCMIVESQSEEIQTLKTKLCDKQTKNPDAPKHHKQMHFALAAPEDKQVPPEPIGSSSLSASINNEPKIQQPLPLCNTSQPLTVAKTMHKSDACYNIDTVYFGDVSISTSHSGSTSDSCTQQGENHSRCSHFRRTAHKFRKKLTKAHAQQKGKWCQHCSQGGWNAYDPPMKCRWLNPPLPESP